jgi:serine/threonine protein kinase
LVNEISHIFAARSLEPMAGRHRGIPALPRPPLPLHNTTNGYQILANVGSGAFSKVFRVSRQKDSMQFAMKVVSKSILGTEKDWDRFQREIDVMHGLDHPNIVRLHDFFEQGDSFYLIMDLCHDGELTDLIIRNDKLNEPIAALMFRQIVAAIMYCHANGVAHRDLKPENIFISKFPTVKVGDFGLCGFQEQGRLMSTFCGSRAYAAPECLLGQEYDGRKSDRWSLGVILYAMVTGRHPWDLSNHATMMRQILSVDFTLPDWISSDCREVILALMELDPDKRKPLDELLNHPWFNVASQAKVASRVGGLSPEITTLPALNFTSRRSKSFEIVSPFEEKPATARSAPKTTRLSGQRSLHTFPTITRVQRPSLGATIGSKRAGWLPPA